MKNMQKYEQLAITELDAYLFGQGTHYEIYNKMGAHVGVKDGKEGVYFAVWAPAAREVYVIGEFNNWNAYGYDMKKISDGGIYDLFIPGAKAGICISSLLFPRVERLFTRQIHMLIRHS